MRIWITMCVFALSITATSSSFASEIYKWTDEEGNVQYSDRPPGAVKVEHVAIRSQPTDPARVQAEVQARTDAQALRAKEEANAPQGPTLEDLRAEAMERDEKCNKYTERQTRFTQNRRIYRLDESGERVYYDEEEMAAARARVDELVDQYCD